MDPRARSAIGGMDRIAFKRDHPSCKRAGVPSEVVDQSNAPEREVRNEVNLKNLPGRPHMSPRRRLITSSDNDQAYRRLLRCA